MQAAVDAVDTLVQLSRGIYPSQLAERGLAPALRQAVLNSPVPVEVVPHGVGRFSTSVEAAAYFCCLEAVQNAAKHSGAAMIRVDLMDEAGFLQCVVEDDGAGFDAATTTGGTGLTNMRDRVEAVGGTLAIRTTPRSGHSASWPCCRRRVAEVRARVAWVLAGLTVRRSPSPTSW